MKAQEKVFIYWKADKYREGGGGFDFSRYEGMEAVNSDYIPITSVDLEIDLPEGFDPRTLLIQCLVREKSLVIREATAKAEALEEKIQQLLALPQGEPA